METTQPHPAAPPNLSFDETLAYLAAENTAAFASLPVFEDNPEEASGARVLVLFRDRDGIKLHYAAGPLFMHAFFEDEIIPLADIPEKAMALRYIPTIYQAEFFNTSLQNAIQSLMKGARTLRGDELLQKKIIPLHPV